MPDDGEKQRRKHCAFKRKYTEQISEKFPEEGTEEAWLDATSSKKKRRTRWQEDPRCEKASSTVLRTGRDLRQVQRKKTHSPTNRTGPVTGPEGEDAQSYGQGGSGERSMGIRQSLPKDYTCGKAQKSKHMRHMACCHVARKEHVTCGQFHVAHTERRRCVA